LSSIAWIQLLVVVLLGTGAQLALKAALEHGASSRADAGLLAKLIRSRLMWIWFGCYLASTLLWLWALRVVPLSQAFPILGLQFALVPIAANRFLKEHFAWEQWLGVAIIVFGVALVGRT
jgi:undecaprenyl phosphate-alpha-L-ara4N flippase subunit ArnE